MMDAENRTRGLDIWNCLHIVYDRFVQPGHGPKHLIDSGLSNPYPIVGVIDVCRDALQGSEVDAGHDQHKDDREGDAGQ